MPTGDLGWPRVGAALLSSDLLAWPSRGGPSVLWALVSSVTREPGTSANSQTPGHPGIMYNRKQWFLSLWFS